MLHRFVGRESVLVLGLAGLLLWAPLPAGSVTPGAELLFRLAAFGLFALVVAARAWRWPWSRALPIIALAGVAMLGLAQSVPWPAGVVAVVSPEHARIYQQASEIVRPAPELAPPAGDLAAAPERSPWAALSLDPAASRSSALSWLAAAALLTAALAGGARSQHRRWLLAALALAALVQMGVGLVRLHAASPGGLGAVLLRPEGRILGTFANPNHLSFFFEMSLVAAAAWAWAELSTLSRTSGRRWALALVSPLLCLVLLAGVVMTGSRAGLAAALVGLAVQAAALPLAGPRKVGLAAALMLVLGLGALVALGARLDISRYARVSLFEENVHSRLLLVPPSLELWQRFPLTGTGLGTFEDAFPLVAPPELTAVRWNRAHNDPLELLLTGGLVGLALGLLTAMALLPPIWRALRAGRRVEDRAAGLAALGALAAAAVHELMDFGLVIPVNTLALLVILGAGAGAGLSRPETPATD